METAKAPVPRLNAEWHKAHPMPKRATLDQRIAWHTEHWQHCHCREAPPNLKEELARRGIVLSREDAAG